MNGIVLIVMALAFICEYVDSSLGMGYGTTLAPLLLLMGFEPLEIVPAILFSEFVSGITAACFHHSLKNVNFSISSKDTKVAIALTGFSVIGTVLGVYLAIQLPAETVKIWMGCIVIFMGAFILFTFNHKTKFRWHWITTVGVIASFNKGISGGGYGPLVMGGQLLSGIKVSNAVAITSLSEAVVCFVGMLLYFFLNKQADWSLAPWLMAGAVLSVPIAAQTLKKIPEKKARLAVAIVIIIIGSLSILKTAG